MGSFALMLVTWGRKNLRKGGGERVGEIERGGVSSSDQKRREWRKGIRRKI